MSRPATHIRLPTARAQQLQTIAEALGTSIVGAVEHLVNRAIEAGTIPDTTPGFELHVADDHVWLVVESFGFPPMTVEQANALGLALFNAGQGIGPATRGFRLGADDAFSLAIIRQGRGIVLAGKDLEMGRLAKASMTPGMALDLARQIFKAAAQCSA